MRTPHFLNAAAALVLVALPFVAHAQTTPAQAPIQAPTQAPLSPANTAPAGWPNAGQATQAMKPAAVAPMTAPSAMTAPAPMAAPQSSGTPAATLADPAANTASTSFIPAMGGDAIPALPLEVQSSNGVNYLNGGIGDEELQSLKSQAGQYNLHIMLSARNGEYISDVTFKIMDAKGATLVSINDAGPYIYAHLAPGHYTLESSAPGESVIKKFKIAITANGIVKEHITFGQ